MSLQKTSKSLVPGSREDRRSLRTRKALVTAAQTLFSARSPENVSIDEIVTEADVTKGSFYNHFSSKDALADEVVRLIRDQVSDRIDEINIGIDDPSACIVRSFCVVLRLGLDQPDRALAFARLTPGTTRLETPINRHLASIISKGIDLGIFKEVGVEDGCLLVIGIVSLAMWHSTENIEVTKNSIYPIAVTLGAGILRALGVTPARARKTAISAADEFFIT